MQMFQLDVPLPGKANFLILWSQDGNVEGIFVAGDFCFVRFFSQSLMPLAVRIKTHYVSSVK